MRTPLRFSTVLLAALLSSAPTAVAQEDDDSERANELLAQAEFALEKERYADAVKLYRLIARKFPATEAGELAARRCAPSAYLSSTLIVDHGPSDNRVDVALMGDGYTLDHQKAFDKLAEDVPPLFEKQRTFREYYSYFNFRRFNLVSADDNVSGFGREEDTALGARVTGTIQGHVAIDPARVRHMLDQAPAHDRLAIVFVRAGILGTAIGGIATIGGRNAKTTVHEFGHSFGGLGDEYATKTHDRGAVWEAPNVSASEDPEQVPWAHWIAAKARGVGVYEGANGQVRDAFKPTASGCVMEDGEFFCEPCREALVLRIHALVDPIERTNHPPYPFHHPASLVIDDRFTFEVEVMQPASHPLEVRWWIFPEGAAPRGPREVEERYASAERLADRRQRGPLWPIEAKPLRLDRVNRTGLHTFEVKRTDLEPGRYRVVCRATDPTKVRGDKLPWVLKDEYDLLSSERAWWIEIPPKD